VNELQGVDKEYKDIPHESFEANFNEWESFAIEKYLWMKESNDLTNHYIDQENKINRKRDNERGLKMPEQTSRKNKDKKLTVHIVPHTHNDVGWLKTIDEYYSGFEGLAQHARVSQILDEVVIELQKDKARRFTYVEMKFF